jgi:hypothetical protein
MILHKAFYLLWLIMLLSSCQQRSLPKLAPEYLYDAKDQKVITSLINNKKNTISLLYGNAVAQKAASDTVIKQLAGARYTLVTWKQKGMPGWYGTNMNGDILSVETLDVLSTKDKHGNLNYRFKPGPGAVPDESKARPEDQIRFILVQLSAARP